LKKKKIVFMSYKAATERDWGRLSSIASDSAPTFTPPSTHISNRSPPKPPERPQVSQYGTPFAYSKQRAEENRREILLERHHASLPNKHQQPPCDIFFRDKLTGVRCVVSSVQPLSSPPPPPSLSSAPPLRLSPEIIFYPKLSSPPLPLAGRLPPLQATPPSPTSPPPTIPPKSPTLFVAPSSNSSLYRPAPSQHWRASPPSPPRSPPYYGEDLLFPQQQKRYLATPSPPPRGMTTSRLSSLIADTRQQITELKGRLEADKKLTPIFGGIITQ